MGDLISRAAALDAIDHERDVLIEEKRLGAEHIVVHHARRIIEELPAVDAIPVEWLKSKRKEALHEGMRPDEVEAVEMVLWMWQKEQEARSWQSSAKSCGSLTECAKHTRDALIVL